MPISGGLYLSSRTPLEQAWGRKLLPSDKFESDWQKIVKKVEGIKDGDIKTEKSKIFIKRLKLKGDETKKIAFLKEWCEKERNHKLSSLIFFANSGFYKESMKWCFITMGEKLDTNAVDVSSSSTTDDEKIKKLVEKLDKEKGTVYLTPKLKKIAFSEKTDKWKDLKKWCALAFSFPYTEEENDVWEIIDKFCNKSKVESTTK